MKYCFGDIVVVENNLIGVVVKSWIHPIDKVHKEVKHDVYVRYFDDIRQYDEKNIQRYMVRHKYLEGDDIIYQNNAVNDTIDIFQPIVKNDSNALTYRERWQENHDIFIHQFGPIFDMSKFAQTRRELNSRAKHCMEYSRNKYTRKISRINSRRIK